MRRTAVKSTSASKTAAPPSPRLGQRLHPRREGPLDRRLQRELDVAPTGTLEGLLDRFDQLRIAQRRSNVAPDHLAVEERFGRPVGTHDLALSIQQEERLGQGIERAFELGPLARELRPVLGAEPGQALDRCRELTGKEARRRGVRVCFALTPGGVLHMARQRADLCQHQAGHCGREQAQASPGQHRRNSWREAEQGKHQEGDSKRQRCRKAEPPPPANRNNARSHRSALLRSVVSGA